MSNAWHLAVHGTGADHQTVSNVAEELVRVLKQHGHTVSHAVVMHGDAEQLNTHPSAPHGHTPAPHPAAG
jgi:hypothetical protein